MRGLNAPFGARCFLTDRGGDGIERRHDSCLNAPFGARCFLTGAYSSFEEFVDDKS